MGQRGPAALAILVFLGLAFLSVRSVLSYNALLPFNEVGVGPFPELQLQMIERLSVWNPDNFGELFIRSTGAYIRVLQYLTGLLGMSGLAVTVGFLVAALAASGLAMQQFVRAHGVPHLVACVAGLAYMLNPIMFHEIVFGHVVDFVFAYAVFPLVLLALGKCLLKPRPHLLLLLLLLLPAATSSVHMFLFTVTLPSIYILTVPIVPLSRRLVSLVVYAFLVGLVQLPWLMPLLLQGLIVSGGGVPHGATMTMAYAPEAYQTWLNLGYLRKHFAELSGVALLGRVWYVVGYGLVLLAFSPLLRRGACQRRERRVWASHQRTKEDSHGLAPRSRLEGLLLIVAICSLGLMIIPRLWMGDALVNVFTSLPILGSVFRSPTTKFAIMYAFATSALIGLSLSHLCGRHGRRVGLVVVAATVVALLLFGMPFLTGDFGGYYTPHTYEGESEISTYMSGVDRKELRVLPWPPDPIVRYDPESDFWQRNEAQWSRDPFIGLFPLPVVHVRSGDLFSETAVMARYLTTALGTGDPERLARLLGNLDVGYVLIRQNVKSPIDAHLASIAGSGSDLEERLLASGEFDLQMTHDGLTVLRNPLAQSHFLVPERVTLTDRRDLSYLAGSDALVDPLTILSGRSSLATRMDDVLLHVDHVLLHGWPPHSLVLALAEDVSIFRPSDHAMELRGDPAFVPYAYTQGWYRDITASRFASPSAVISRGVGAELVIPVTVKQGEQYLVLVEYVAPPNGPATMRIDAGDQSTRVDTSSGGAGTDWVILGPLQLSESQALVRVLNLSGTNIISCITVVSEAEYMRALDRTVSLLKNLPLTYVLYSGGEYLHQAREIPFYAPVEGWYELSLVYSAEAPSYVRVSFDDQEFYCGPDQNQTQVEIYVSDPGQHELQIMPGAPRPVFDMSFSTDLVDARSLQAREGNSALGDEAPGSGRCLCVSTDWETPNQWSWITSESFDVEPGQDYLVVTAMKASNVTASHIVLRGYSQSSQRWVQLGQVPSGTHGNTDWTSFQSVVSVPTGVEQAQIVLNAGWVQDPAHGEAITCFADVEVYELQAVPRLEGATLVRSDACIDCADHAPARVVTSSRSSPTSYRVEVDAERPFMLVFAESFNPFWIARSDNHTYAPVPVNYGLTGFYIGETGGVVITVNLGLQQFATTGGLVFAGACIGLLIASLVDLQKRHGRRNRRPRLGIRGQDHQLNGRA